MSGVRASSMRMLSTSSTIAKLWVASGRPSSRVAPAVLDLLLQRRRHVVAQVVEAELGVGAVRDVGGVGVALLLVGLHVLQHADREPEEVVDRAHPLGVATREVVVHRDDVDALAGERVERDGERRGQGLALTRLHLGDLARVQHHAADHLNVEVAHAHRAPTGLAGDREGLRKHVLERRAFVLHALLQLLETLAQRVVALLLKLLLEGPDRSDSLLVALELFFLADVERAIKETHGSEGTSAAMPADLGEVGGHAGKRRPGLGVRAPPARGAGSVVRRHSPPCVNQVAVSIRCPRPPRAWASRRCLRISLRRFTCRASSCSQRLIA